MKKSKRIFSLLFALAICMSTEITALAAEDTTGNVEEMLENQSESYPPVTIGSRVGEGIKYGKGTVSVYVTLDKSYSKGVVVRAGATGNDCPYSCSVVYPNGTVRVLCSANLDNIYANGGRTPYTYVSYSGTGTYEFIFSMEDTTKTTACLAWIYEVTGYL